MKTFPLYPTPPGSPLDYLSSLFPDKTCRKCSLHKQALSPCLPADGVPGGVLFVGKQPSMPEDVAGRVFVGPSSQTLRRSVVKYYKGPVVLDNAVKCCVTEGGPTDGQIASCRPYLKRVVEECMPKRIIALGSTAIYALLGRRPPVMSVRRGCGWLNIKGSLVPVLMLMHPAACRGNRLLTREFEKDLCWALTTDSLPKPPVAVQYHVVETEEDARAAVENIMIEAPWFAYDLEWAGVPLSNYFEVLTAAVCPSGTDEAYVWDRKAMNDPKVRAPLLGLLEDRTIGKVGHNVKSDNSAAAYAFDVTVRNTIGDTRLWRKLLESDCTASLSVSAELVGMGGHKEENDIALNRAVGAINLGRKSINNQINLFDPNDDPAYTAALEYSNRPPKEFAYALVPEAVRSRYCARDSVSTSRLGDLLWPRIQNVESVHRIWTRIVQHTTDAVGQMERWGIRVSADAINDFHHYIDSELVDVRRRLGVYGAFNPGSTKDLAELLFKKLKLQAMNRTPSGAPSTDKAALNALKGKHPIIVDLLEFRRLSTLQERYGLSLLPYILDDGRIHPQIKIDGTRTGRFSCKNPALHQLPTTVTFEGQCIKRCYIASPRCALLSLDFSQIELRTGAFLSDDDAMIDLFVSGEDFHTGTAKLVSQLAWGIPPEKVGKKERRDAKTINFGLFYGMTDEGFAKRLSITVEQAAQLRKAILGKFSKLSRWMDTMLRLSRSTGYSYTYWDGEQARIRELFDIMSQEQKRRSRAENGAVNTPVQGSANDFTVNALCKIIAWIIRERFPAKLVLTVHDSLIFDVVEAYLEELVEVATYIMTNQYSGRVPLVVDAEYGGSLGDLKPYQIPS